MSGGASGGASNGRGKIRRCKGCGFEPTRRPFVERPQGMDWRDPAVLNFLLARRPEFHDLPLNGVRSAEAVVESV